MIAGNTTVGVLAPGVAAAELGMAAEKVRLATNTIVAGVTAMAEVEETPLGLVSFRDAAMEGILPRSKGGGNRRSEGTGEWRERLFDREWFRPRARTTVRRPWRRVTSCLMDFASSVERLSSLSVTWGRAKPVVSTLAHDRVAEIPIAHATADERHASSIAVRMILSA